MLSPAASPRRQPPSDAASQSMAPAAAPSVSLTAAGPAINKARCTAGAHAAAQFCLALTHLAGQHPCASHLSAGLAQLAFATHSLPGVIVWHGILLPHKIRVLQQHAEATHQPATSTANFVCIAGQFTTASTSLGSDADTACV